MSKYVQPTRQYKLSDLSRCFLGEARENSIVSELSLIAWKKSESSQLIPLNNTYHRYVTVKPPNRRIRTRTYGGVTGRARERAFLCRLQAQYE